MTKKEIRRRMEGLGKWQSYVARRQELQDAGVAPAEARRRAAAEVERQRPETSLWVVVGRRGTVQTERAIALAESSSVTTVVGDGSGPVFVAASAYVGVIPASERDRPAAEVVLRRLQSELGAGRVELCPPIERLQPSEQQDEHIRERLLRLGLLPEEPEGQDEQVEGPEGD